MRTRASPGANQKCFTRAARELNVLCVSCPRRGRAQLPVQRQERQQLQQPPPPPTCCDTPSVVRAAPQARANGAHHRVQLEPAEARARRGRFSLVLEAVAQRESRLARVSSPCSRARRGGATPASNFTLQRVRRARAAAWRVLSRRGAGLPRRGQLRSRSWPWARRSRAVRAAAPHFVESAKALGTWRARD